MTRLARPHRHGFAISLPVRTRFAFRALLEKRRAQGMPGARCTRSLACESEKHASIVTTGSPNGVRHSLRDGFTAYSELSPVNGLCCHRHPQEACFPGT
jgi:hypothetical protein